MNALSLLRFITHPEGVTAASLAKSAGQPLKVVRSWLAELEADGKIERKRAPVGKPHLWWRSGKQATMGGIDAVLAAELAAVIHDKGKLRAVLDRLSVKAANPAHRALFAMVRKSKNPKKVLALALAELERDRIQCEEESRGY